MALTQANIAALTAEINTDPLSIGYSPYKTSGNDGGIAGLLNSPRTGQTCQSGPLTPQQVLNAITLTDLPAGTDTALLAWIAQIVSMPIGLDLNNAKVAAVFTRFFVSTSASYQALAALRTISGCSRAPGALWRVVCDCGQRCCYSVRTIDDGPSY